ncbi:MAG: hypothetical protein K8H86_07120, partial [Ignavibacteriaceae bacterium]|nr:hypothetical protein [Ignavibacteriaceae bacterium]
LEVIMSLHSYSKCWLHLIWGTLGREPFFSSEDAQHKVSNYFYRYCTQLGFNIVKEKFESKSQRSPNTPHPGSLGFNIVKEKFESKSQPVAMQVL